MNVTITTAHSLAVLGSSFPPSGGSFGPDHTGLVKPLLDFLSQISASFFINAYPYFAYKSSPDQVPLDYKLFQQNAGVVDPITNLHYDNLLYAQIDAVYSALSALGYANLEVIVSETGWPSMGDPDEAGATPQNAQTYNGNLLQRLAQKQGTPLRPTLSLQDYIFALFNEDMKPGPTSERNYGLFKPDGTPIYNVGLIGSLPTASSTSPSSYNFMSSAKVFLRDPLCALPDHLSPENIQRALVTHSTRVVAEFVTNVKLISDFITEISFIYSGVAATFVIVIHRVSVGRRRSRISGRKDYVIVEHKLHEKLN
eukprot:Gb_10212 [translate_table: standard]